jgi:hypothetical protein
LKLGVLPAQAKANDLDLESIPIELSDLNQLEVHLISLRIPFMKMVALPCGKQRAIHGPAVNVPTDMYPSAKEAIESIVQHPLTDSDAELAIEKGLLEATHFTCAIINDIILSVNLQ